MVERVPSVRGGTVPCYSREDLLLQEVTRDAPAGSEEAAASSSNKLEQLKTHPESE